MTGLLIAGVLLLTGCSTNVETFPNADVIVNHAAQEQSMKKSIAAENRAFGIEEERSNTIMTLNNKQQTVLDHALGLITVPENYTLMQVREGVQNGENVFVFRYSKGENSELLGEHFSFTIIEKSNQLLGVTWMDKQFAKGTELPSKEETEVIAKEYLAKVEPDLFGKLQNLWIAPHDETIVVNGNNVTVTGMKYKCFIPTEDTYAWVIAGPDNKVITFERGIVWQGGRVSEKWLHDSWLKERGF